MRRWLSAVLMGLTLLGYGLGQPLPVLADSPFVTQEIRYHLPEAGEVTLVWGINGWATLSEETQPMETVIKKGLMRTLMVRQDDTFSAVVRIPAGATLNYGFQITKMADSSEVSIWDGIGNQDYHITPTSDGVTHVRLTTQEIRYYLPEAKAVTLVWGLNNWHVVPKFIFPAETVIKDQLMYTSMKRVNDTFVTTVRTPTGATLDYKFLIVGDEGEIWDANGEEKPDYHTLTMPGATIGIKGPPLPGQVGTSNSFLQVSLYLLAGIVIIAVLGMVLHFIPLFTFRSVMLVLVVVMLFGLSLRIWEVIGDTRQRGPDWPATLSGHELSYLDQADSIRQDSSLQEAGAMALYPLFLTVSYLLSGHSYVWVFYIQAFIGATAICLTFLLARYFTGTKLSLLASALVALHPALISQTTRFSAEVLYTSLVLLAIWGLLWAMAEPQPHRFIIAGLPVAVANLCHPALLLFPVVLLLILPRFLGLRRIATLGLSYTAPTILVILFLSYQAYYPHQTFWLSGILGRPLWWGSPELYYLMQDQRPLTQIWDWYLDPASNGGYDQFQIGGAHYFAQRAINSISTYPDIYILYSFLKIPFFWVGHPAIDWPDYAMFNIETMRPYFSIPHIAGILVTRVLPFVTLLGLIILHEVHNQVRGITPLLVICAYFMLVYALTYPELRFSEPLHPLLLTIIVTAIRPKDYTWPEFVARTGHQRYYTYS